MLSKSRSNFSRRALATQALRSALLLALTASFTMSAARAASGQDEVSDRVVDQAAVDMQDEADADLSALVKQYRGSKQESEMLLRLAELRLEIAEGMFRVAYGPGEQDLKKAYRAKLASGIQPLSRILSTFPKSEEVARSLFLRAKASKELGENANSLKDFEAFLAKYSSRPEAAVASIGVADLCLAKKDFKRVISVLNPLIAKPTHPLYPNALYKRAWAFHSEGKPLLAVKELRTLAAHFAKQEQAGKLSAGDRGLRENVQGDIPSMAFMAFASGTNAYPISSVNSLMRSYDTGAGYRRMALNFTDQLRTSDREGDVRTWKAIVLKSDPSRAENLPMLIATFEYDLERGSYADVVKTSNEMASILSKDPSAEGADEARKLVVRAANVLTKRISDYKKSAQATDAEKQLSAVLVAFDQMAPNDIRRIGIRWNLAETYFAQDRYESAAQVYRYIAKNWVGDAKAAAGKPVSPEAADLKAISSRYESLKAAGAVPSELKAVAMIAPSKDATKVAMTREWIQWIDANYNSNGAARGQGLAEFGFEANRTLYSLGFQDEAMARMKAYAVALPSAKSSVAAASLVVDTWIARGRWDQVEAEAVNFSNQSKWAKASFASDMRVQAAGAKFKRAETAYAAKRYDESATQAQEFLKSYPKSNLAVDANGIACNSALNASQLEAAVSCFDALAERFPNSAASVEALRTAARIEDDRMKFSSAANRYLKYLDHDGRGLKAAESLNIRKRVLLLARASGDAGQMAAFGSSKLCAPKLQAECEMNVALATLIRSGSSEQNPKAALTKMSSARKELRAIYAMAALEQWKHLDAKTLDRSLKALTKEWKSTDASVRYFLIARATKTIPAILIRDRSVVAKSGMAATESAITKRMKLLQGLEARTGLMAAIPVTSVQAAALETVFLGYSDLIADIRAIPAPANAVPSQKAEHARLISSLTQPLVLKSRKIRDSFAILDLKEKSGLNADKADGLFDRPVAGNASYESLRKEWANAIRDENWSRVSFLSDEVVDMKNVPANWSKAARAISLATAGASAEAKIVFGDACRDSSGSPSLREACRSVSQSSRGKGRG